MKRKIVVAVTGASGSIYAKVLLDKLCLLQDQIEEVAIVMSDNAKDVWRFELSDDNYNNYPFKFYQKNDFIKNFTQGSKIMNRKNNTLHNTAKYDKKRMA